MRSTAPMLDAKWPGLTERFEIMNSLISSQSCGSCSAEASADRKVSSLEIGVTSRRLLRLLSSLLLLVSCRQYFFQRGTNIIIPEAAIRKTFLSVKPLRPLSVTGIAKSTRGQVRKIRRFYEIHDKCEISSFSHTANARAFYFFVSYFSAFFILI